jgi:hypothetical protein
MQTTYFFNKHINYHYNNSDLPEKEPDISILFSDNPAEYKKLTKLGRIQKMEIINKKILRLKSILKDRVNIFAIQHIYTCEPKIVTPVFEVRLKYLKYGELTDEDREYFYKAQRTYQVLYRFINKIKIKRMRKFDNEYDLCMVPLSSLPPKQTIWLFENGIRFHFNVRDLLKIIVSALSSSFYMFEAAKMPKNPFTNSELSVFQLNLIYTRLCELKTKIPTVVELFYKAEFDIVVFKRINRSYLIELAIETHYNKDIQVTQERIVDVLEMIHDFCNPFMMIRFHKNFPSNIIYQVFRPYLILRARWAAFYCVESRAKLVKGLKLFNMFNPMFGHCYIDKDGNTGFDDRHIPYGDIFNSKFYGIETPAMIDVLISNKGKYHGFLCINIEPIDDVQYILMRTHAGFISEEMNVQEQQPSVIYPQEEQEQVQGPVIAPLYSSSEDEDEEDYCYESEENYDSDETDDSR